MRIKTFIDDDFLLTNETAKILYHDYAKDLPIIDYHNHLNPAEILEDKQFNDISDAWLSGDHYKWRLMRANGIDEDYITGLKPPEEKFLKWAETVPKILGNPLYHWTHLELLRYFNIDYLLDEETAKEIYEETTSLLQSKDHSVRSLLKMKNVELVATTDDPTDNLKSHIALQQEDLEIEMVPTFRPDNALRIESETFLSWINKLEEVTDKSIEIYDDFIDCLFKRIDFFDSNGCKASDHALDKVFYEECTAEEVSNIFKKKLTKADLSLKEINQFKTYTLQLLAEKYNEKDWVMQLHIGALRNNNTKMFNKLGPDTGFDSIGDGQVAEKLSRFLNSLSLKDALPKTILYTLNDTDYMVLSTMAGNFNSSPVKGKIQLGPAWWFNDTLGGIENQLDILANTSVLANFVGMLTDSRSFLSFPRHEYFRRVLCNLLGTWVEEGKAPKDMKLLKEYTENICYYNAKSFFNLT